MNQDDLLVWLSLAWLVALCGRQDCRIAPLGSGQPVFRLFFRCHQTRPVRYREQVNYAAMRDTRQRMVSISLHAYLMLIMPLSV